MRRSSSARSTSCAGSSTGAASPSPPPAPPARERGATSGRSRGGRCDNEPPRLAVQRLRAPARTPGCRGPRRASLARGLVVARRAGGSRRCADGRTRPAGRPRRDEGRPRPAGHPALGRHLPRARSPGGGRCPREPDAPREPASPRRAAGRAGAGHLRRRGARARGRRARALRDRSSRRAGRRRSRPGPDSGGRPVLPPAHRRFVRAVEVGDPPSRRHRRVPRHLRPPRPRPAPVRRDLVGRGPRHELRLREQLLLPPGSRRVELADR